MPENKFNTPEMLARCVPMSRLQSVLGGKWKIMILWYVTAYRVQRFGELQRRLDGVTQSSLTKSLRELERDGFLHREVYQEIPPRVEYTLTDMGQSFAPILHQMLAWSEEPEGWYLTLPGAEEGQPVTREMLEAMLP